MKRIIDGKVYNTDTAEIVDKYEYGLPGDLDYVDEALYRKRKTGEFFLAGEGGPRTIFGRYDGMGTYHGGEGIVRVTYEQAQNLVRERSKPEVYEKFFAVVDKTGRRVVSLNLTEEAAKRLRDASEKSGRSMSELVCDAIMATLK